MSVKSKANLLSLFDTSRRTGISIIIYMVLSRRRMSSARTFIEHPVLHTTPLDAEKLLHRDKPHAPRLQAVNRTQRRLHARGVAVVQEDHIPVIRFPQDDVQHLVRIAQVPVARVNRPVQQRRVDRRELRLTDEP